MSIVTSTTVNGSGGASTATSEEIQAAIALELMLSGATSTSQSSASTNSGSQPAADSNATYTVTVADMGSADPWAAVTQRLYGTGDAAAIAKLKAATGQPMLSAGLQLFPPMHLAFENTVAQSALRDTAALTSTSTSSSFVALEATSPSALGAQVAYGPEGKGLAVWVQGQELLSSQFDKSTGSWGVASAVNGGLAGAVGVPSLSTSANGNMLVTWVQGNVLYARRFIDGQWDTVSSNIPLLAQPAFETLGMPVGTINDAGQAAVVFTLTNGDQVNISVSVFNGQHWAISSERLDALGEGGSGRITTLPRIAMDASGNLAVAWAQENGFSGSNDCSLRVCEFQAAQGRWLPQPLSIPSVAGQSGFNNVDLKMDSNGNALLVWVDINHGTLFSKRFDRSSNTWEPEVLVTSGSIRESSFAMSANGHAILACRDAENRIHVRRFIDGAWMQGDAELVNSPGQVSASGIALAINDEGQAIVSFNQSDGSGAHVFINRLHDGAWTGVEQVETVATLAPRPAAVAIDAQGAALVVSALRRTNTVNDLYGRSFSAIEQRYVVPENATWESVTEALYGTRDAAAVDALKARLGQTLLVPGQPLSNLPVTLDFTKTQAVQKTINPAALNPVPPQIVMAAAAPAAAPAPAPAPAPVPHVVGYTVAASDLSAADPWAAIAQKLYGDAAAGASLKQSLGQPALSVGAQISPPVNLAFDRTLNGQAVLSADRLSQAPGSWGTVSAMESSPGDVYTPQVAFGANGDGLAVWAQGADLMASVYSQATGSWAPAIAIDGNLPDGPFLPHLSASANGNMLVTWMQDSKLYARRYVNGGWDASSSSIPVVGTAAYYSTGSINDNGQATVVFAGNDGLHWNAVARYFDGQQWQSSPIRLDDLGGLNGNDIDTGQLPRVAMDPAGNATVMWLQPAAGETAASLFVSRFEAASGQWSNASSTLLENSGAAVNSFRVAADVSGNCVATWVQGGQLYAKSFDIGTGQWGTASLLASGVYADISLSMSGNGNAIVAFNNANGTALYARRYINGAWAGSAAELLSPAQSSTSAPNVAINDSGAAIVTFKSYDGVGEHVYTNRFEGGVWRGPEQAESSAKYLKNSAVAIDAAGNAQVVMSMVAGVDNFSLYGKRFNAGPSQYVVPAGSTWESLTEALYGTRQAPAVEALKAWVGTPVLTAGQVLKNPPPTLNYTWTEAAQRSVDPVALIQSMVVATFAASAAAAPAPAAPPTAAPAPAPAPAPDPELVAQLQAQRTSRGNEQAAAQYQVDTFAQQLSQRQLELASASSAEAFAQQSLLTWNAAVTAPPRGRPQEQWDDIAACWAAYNGQPQYLMQLMVQYGFDAYDLAYVTGQSVVQVGQYLTGNGAFDGFANWSMSSYQAIVSNATQLQQQALQATLARNQALQTLQSAQIRLNALNDQVAEIDRQVQQLYATGSSAPAPAPGRAVFGGGGIPGSGTANDVTVAAALAMMGYATSRAVFGGGGVPGSVPPDKATAATALALLGYGTPAAAARAVFGGGALPGSLPSDKAAAAAALALLGYGVDRKTASGAATPTESKVDPHWLRMTNILITPPHPLTQQQWTDIRAVWLDRSDEPQLLMKLMSQYGFDAADLAYATGQTLSQVGLYLIGNGAADGFAGWSVAKGYQGDGAVRISPTATDGYPAPAPQKRTGPLWTAGAGSQSVAAIWQQYQAQPYRLMQTMAEFGISAQELAQASGQSLYDVELYLSRAGAPAGFAGGNLIDRISVDTAFLTALDAASYPLLQGMTGDFDVGAFAAWYAAQDTQASRDFATLHGSDFSKTQATVVAGHWEGNNDSGYVWRGAQIGYQGALKNSLHDITAYLNYSQASEFELLAADFTLSDELNQELLAHFGSQLPLPASEFVERMRARYGSERATVMYRIQQASQSLRAVYAAAIDAEYRQPPSLEELRNEAPGVALDSQNTRFTSTSQPWWSITQHIEHGNNYETPHFDLQAYTTWYADQNTVASKLFKEIYGSEITTVVERTSLSEGDYQERIRSYIGAGGASEVLMGGWSTAGDQNQVWVPTATGPYGTTMAVVGMDPTLGKMKLYNGEGITFDPVMGFVTAHENVDSSSWAEMLPLLFVTAVTAAVAGPAAATGAGFTSGTVPFTIAAAGFGAAIGTVFTGLMTTGKINLKGAIKSAITAMATAGFAKLINLEGAGISFEDGVRVVKWAERLPAIGAQALFSGIVGELTAGNFSAGFTQALATQLGNEVMQSIYATPNFDKLSLDEQAAYKLMGRSISAALTVAANPKNPLQTLAFAFVNSLGSEIVAEVGNINAGSPTRIARDDEGNVMPGVVNPNSTEAQQRLQLYNQLRLQRIGAEEASSIVQKWVDSGAQALFNMSNGIAGAVNISTGSMTDLNRMAVIPSAQQSVETLIGINDERFNQLLNSMVQAGDEEGLYVFGALMLGEAQRASANANAAFPLIHEQYLLMLQRAGQINQALQGMNLGGIPGIQPPDPTDPLWQGLPTSNGTAINLRDLVNTRPADWPGWAKGLLVRLGISTEELKNFLPSFISPVLITAWTDLIIHSDGNAENNKKLADQRYRNNPSLQDPSKLLGQSLQGVGTWVAPGTPRGNSGADYQESITGVPAGIELNVGGTVQATANGTTTAVGGANFDGWRLDGTHTVLIDTKHWDSYPPPNTRFWQSGTLSEAARQLDAASGVGAKVEWQVSSLQAAQQLHELFSDPAVRQRVPGIENLEIRVVPKKP